MTQVKQAVAGVDQEEVKMAVKSRMVDIVMKTKTLAAQYQAMIATGSPVVISPAELLPVTEVSKIKLRLDTTSSEKDCLTSALYVTTNTIARNQLKTEVWADLSASMKAKKVSNAVIEHGQAGTNPAIDFALDKEVAQFCTNIEQGQPMMSEQEIQEVNAWREKQASLAAPVAADPALESTQSLPLKSSDSLASNENKKSDVPSAAATEKDAAALPPGQFEKQEAIRS